MFEDSLVSSRLEAAPTHTRWLAAGSLLLQVSFAVCWIAVPLLHPETLPLLSSPPKPLTIVPRREPPPPRPQPRVIAASTPGPAIPVYRSTTPARISASAVSGGPDWVSSGVSFLSMAATPNTLTGVPNVGSGPAIHLSPSRSTERSGPLHISSGVSAGLLFAPIRPVYPRLAIAAHVGGTVVVAALISKSGTIENAHVVSGPTLLANAALDAVREARYRPYLLNGQPTEVETTITVNFRLGGGD